jgi:hypothetical protein
MRPRFCVTHAKSPIVCLHRCEEQGVKNTNTAEGLKDQTESFTDQRTADDPAYALGSSLGQPGAYEVDGDCRHSGTRQMAGSVTPGQSEAPAYSGDAGDDARPTGPARCAHLPRSRWNWRLDRVYFLAFLNPSRGQPDPALTARLASPGSVGRPAAGTRLIYRSCRARRLWDFAARGCARSVPSTPTSL